MAVTKTTQLRFASCMLAALIISICVFLSLPLEVKIDFEGLGMPSAVIIFMLSIGAYARMRTMGNLADAAQTLALTLLMGLFGGVLALFAARSAGALVDGQLRGLDTALGLSASGLITQMANWPIWAISGMQTIYQSSFPLVLTSLAVLPLLNRSQEAWRLCFLFGLCLAVCALISCFTPAYGSYSTAISNDIVSLPPQAGRYFWTSLARVRSDDHLILSLKSLSGVITFPSFHAIMAALLAQAWWANRYLRWPILLWSGSIVVTTIPMGGHYFSDLIAGLLVWLVCNEIARAVANHGVQLGFGAGTRIGRKVSPADACSGVTES